VSLFSPNGRLDRVNVVSEPSPRRYQYDTIGLRRCPTTRSAEPGCPATRGWSIQELEFGCNLPPREMQPETTQVPIYGHSVADVGQCVVTNWLRFY
jgi:hypothetical protein